MIFDGLKDPVKKAQKTPKGASGVTFGPDTPSNTVKKQALTRN
jgi:hypothetical protein